MVNRKIPFLLALLLFITVMLAAPVELSADEGGQANQIKQLIYDDAGLLTQEEYQELNLMANELGAERETDIMIVTYDVEGYDVMKMMQDFYDYYGPGFDKPYGNTAILTLDMSSREFYVGGFYKAETYLANERTDKIRDKISPDLSEGNYLLAFQKYIKTTHKYMAYHPSLNPDVILFNIWVQLGFAVLLGWFIVRMMVRRSGSRSTVDSGTYEDQTTSGLVDYSDSYSHTSTSSRRIESSSSSSGGDSGGGTTSGGHSHSGSRGSF